MTIHPERRAEKNQTQQQSISHIFVQLISTTHNRLRLAHFLDHRHPLGLALLTPFTLFGRLARRLLLIFCSLALTELFPLPPSVEVNKSLHAAPLHDFALKLAEIDGLF